MKFVRSTVRLIVASTCIVLTTPINFNVFGFEVCVQRILHGRNLRAVVSDHGDWQQIKSFGRSAAMIRALLAFQLGRIHASTSRAKQRGTSLVSIEYRLEQEIHHVFLCMILTVVEFVREESRYDGVSCLGLKHCLERDSQALLMCSTWNFKLLDPFVYVQRRVYSCWQQVSLQSAFMSVVNTNQDVSKCSHAKACHDP